MVGRTVGRQQQRSQPVRRLAQVRRESSESALARCPRAAPAPRALQSSKSASSLTRGSGTPGEESFFFEIEGFHEDEGTGSA